ncbi:hypothetical protein F0U59_37790 [Archangium gephyra]|nr:hypothetical protein F0U59_37790 [Archangium gephyra]
MKMTMRNVCGALVGLSLAACGPALEEEQGTSQQEASLEAGCTELNSHISSHSCLHSNNVGVDHISVTGTSGLTASTPGINTEHKQYNVTLPAGATGTVKFRPAYAGSWAFFRTQNNTISVKDGSTTLSPALTHTVSVSGCSLVTVTVFDLPSTTTDYQVDLGTASGNLVGVVAEHVEGHRIRYYQDLDNDTWGNTSVSIYSACVPPSGYITRRYDCNDTNASINPSATEITGNSVDENCNGSLTN